MKLFKLSEWKKVVLFSFKRLQSENNDPVLNYMASDSLCKSTSDMLSFSFFDSTCFLGFGF